MNLAELKQSADGRTDGQTARQTDGRTLECKFLNGGFNIFKVAGYKKWRHRFSHYMYKPMGIFLDVQGQLPPQSVLRAGRFSISYELSGMSPLLASMKRIG